MVEKEKKVTIMVLKVDLQCHKCYKKVKNILCKFPQIRDQMYDEKQNVVIIKVVCCSPEKLRDKLCCKGGGVIKSIEIKDPPTPKPPPEKPKDPPTPKPPPPEKPKDPPTPKPPPEKPKEDPPKPPAVTKPPECPSVPFNTCCSDCYHGRPGGPCYSGSGARVPFDTCCSDCYHGRPGGPCYSGSGARVPFDTCCSDCYHGRPGGPCYSGSGARVPTPPVPFDTCCSDCYHGRPGGPCYSGSGAQGPAPYIQYDVYCGRPIYDSYGGGVPGNSFPVTRSQCFSEENPQACTIM